ncbi:hypothetical protein G3R49_05750 [Shewanella sp. WXL01]|uniref:hypothetical protein n=1 Tax=Shewanella sp. WXL01 TaxID=2709721 RepID=UPI001438645F|nr:hypothetical protein [Shewanella sp. WXL01]NKF50072.1 hypothetical protein [Shewanella sp. WXL01]
MEKFEPRKYLDVGTLITGVDILHFDNAVDSIYIRKLQSNWLLGNWEKILPLIESDETELCDFAKLIKLAVLQQVGDFEEFSEQLNLTVELIKNSDVTKELVCDILLSGLYCRLARVHLLKGDGERAKQIFRQSIVALGVTSDIDEITFVRYMGECKRVSREQHNPSGLSLISSKPISYPNVTDLIAENNKLSLIVNTYISNTKYKAASKLDALIDIRSKQSQNVIVVAGMRHSGSTALFNIIRIAHELSGVPLLSDYSEKPSCKEVLEDERNSLLIKTHEFRDDIATRSSYIFTTRRDLRDSVASAKRRDFPMLQKVGGVLEYAKYNRSLHAVWDDLSNFEFIYEEFMQAPSRVIARIVEVLGFDEKIASEVFSRVTNLPTNDYHTTLLSSTHITDPERKLSYRTTLDDKSISTINKQHLLWLRKYGYE